MNVDKTGKQANSSSLDMSIPYAQVFSHTADGTLWGFLADALILPTGLITAIYLTRTLGPNDYGLFTLAATLIAWLSLAANSLFMRTTIKFISEARDWRPVGTTVLRLNMICGFCLMLLLWSTAGLIAGLLGVPELNFYLKLFAIEPLLLVTSSAHRGILIGIGNYRQVALPKAVRWVSRLCLMILLVEMGLSVTGAILGSIGAVLIELIFYRRYIRPNPFSSSVFPAGRLWRYTTPLFLSALCFQVLGKLDLFAVTALGGTATLAGIYGAAHNLSIVPELLVMSFSPLLLATFGHLSSQGQMEDARQIGQEALRFIIGILPFAGLVAGASYEIMVLIFGSAYSDGAPLLAFLIWGKLGIIMISVTTTIMIAAGKPRWTIMLAGPLLVIALIGHFLLIPRLGAVGAAIVTSSVEVFGAVLALTATYRLWQIVPPPGTMVRSILLTILAYTVAAFWSSPDLWLIPKLLVIMVMIPLGYGLLGEFKRNERSAALAFIRRYAFLRDY